MWGDMRKGSLWPCREIHMDIYIYSRLLVMSALDGDGAPQGRVGVRSPGFGTYGCWGEGWGKGWLRIWGWTCTLYYI